MPMHNNWFRKLRLLQLAVIAWLLAAQFLFWQAQGGGSSIPSRLIWSSSLLALLALAIYLLPAARSKSLTSLSAIAEVALIGLSSLVGSVSGYQLLIFLTLAKAGLLLDTRQWALFSLVTVTTYLITSNLNSQLLIQSSSEFTSSSGVLGILLGRDLPALLAGCAVVVALVWAIRTETRHRIELEILSAQLEKLSADLERKRILVEVEDSVETLLEQIDTNIGRITDDPSEQTTEKLEQTRNLAGEALNSVRRALKLLRKVD